jgi:NodT family efflux transporter outer membrane factor (OMF) lipoprotein
VSIAALLGACALQPPPTGERLLAEQLPNARVPPRFTAGAETSAVQDRWLASFGDARLQRLADEALAYNLDLQLAAARVEAAAVSVRIAGGALYPTLDVAARTSGNGTGSSGQLSGVIFPASWELDLWGRLRYAERAADSQYASAEADRRYARQSIVATLAKAWFLATEAVLQQRLVDDSLAAAERLVQLAQERMRIGIGSALDVTLAQANVQTLRDARRQVALSIEQSRRALEMLLGRYPAGDIELASELPALPPRPVAGVPSELLERRPDVIAAQARVAAAFDRVGEAQAARLPRISLTAAVSWLSSSVFVLQQRDDPTGGFGATLFWTVFDAGRLASQVELRTAEQKQAAVAWGQTAQRAFNEVEGALASEAALADRAGVLDQAVADRLRALALQDTRYRVGAGDLRAVVQQQIAVQDARLALLRVQGERRVQRVQLHLALGGDFGDPGETRADATAN